MPCLNEAETLALCIEKAKQSLQQLGLNGEVLIADNGSKDGSIEIAEKLGARVARIQKKGYGNALRGGIEAAYGKWIIMGDADNSYDFANISHFIEKLKEGYDLVMGCRLSWGDGKIVSGAMPWSHRWIGNPGLTLMSRLFFKCPINDLYCGLRAFRKESYQRMELRTTGMEFAIEMVVKATLTGMRISEVPITLHKDGRSRAPHLRTIRDGWRSLRFMLLYSPLWLFLLPGLFLSIFGFIFSVLLILGPLQLGSVILDLGTLTISSMFLPVGIQLIAFACYTKMFAIAEGLLPNDTSFSRIFQYLTLERGIMLGILLILGGGALFARSFQTWGESNFGRLSYEQNLRLLIPCATLITLGVQIVFSSFFVSVLGLKIAGRTPPTLQPD